MRLVPPVKEPPGPRVAHVVCSDAFAGVERYIASVAPALARRGFDVTVIGGDPRRMEALLGASAVTYVSAATTVSAWRQLLRARPLDLVHAHMTAAELAAVFALPLVRAPIVATRHFAARRGSSLPGRLAALLIDRSVRQEVAVSRFVAGSIQRPSIVITNGVPQAEASNARRAVVLMAQRLEREKEVDVGIRAWASSGLAARGWRLVVAGTGALEDQLRALAESVAAGSVDFVGLRSDLAPLLSEASIFLAPAGADGFGLAVVEAMAQGLPVVATASGGHLETVGSCSSTWLFPTGDHQACADRLRRLAADPSLRSAYGQALQDVQRRQLGLEAHIDRLVELYRACGVARLSGERTEAA